MFSSIGIGLYKISRKSLLWINNVINHAHSKVKQLATAIQLLLHHGPLNCGLLVVGRYLVLL